MIEKLRSMEERFKEVEQLISQPEIHKDQQRYKELMQEHSYLLEIVERFREYQDVNRQMEENTELLHAEGDPELKEMAREEAESLQSRMEELTDELRLLLAPKDPLDGKDIIMEIRAGTGGDEASLFAADLYRMYGRYAEAKRWKIEVMDSSPTEVGGFKEIVFSMSGKAVYGELKYESGVHRVQRIPETESGGRIHTSAVTVAVLPEAEDTDIQISNEEIRVDVYRSSGPGGQSVNTTDSAVRITHIPTGLVVTCQDEKSQHKNKAKALRVLKARLYEQEEMRKRTERDSARRSQIGSGDRSERIRTYNYPQNRLTDHRINLTLYRLDSVLQGDLKEIIDSLQLSDREASLKAELT